VLGQLGCAVVRPRRADHYLVEFKADDCRRGGDAWRADGWVGLVGQVAESELQIGLLGAERGEVADLGAVADYDPVVAAGGGAVVA